MHAPGCLHLSNLTFLWPAKSPWFSFYPERARQSACVLLANLETLRDVPGSLRPVLAACLSLCTPDSPPFAKASFWRDNWEPQPQSRVWHWSLTQIPWCGNKQSGHLKAWGNCPQFIWGYICHHWVRATLPQEDATSAHSYRNKIRTVWLVMGQCIHMLAAQCGPQTTCKQPS